MKIAYSFPDQMIDNDFLAKRFPEWSAEKIFAKTGIRSRHVVGAGETAIDLAERACRKLFRDEEINPDDIDYLLLCTQSPEFALPSSACLLHERLKLRHDAGALCFDHGCSGFIYGLSLAKGLAAGKMAQRVLLVMAETYSRYLADNDKSTRTIFGDGAAAVLIDAAEAENIGSFSFGTDGSGADRLIVRDGTLFMDGSEIFNFTLDVVPKTIDDVLSKNGISMDDIDMFVFHQANKFMLDAIGKINNLPKDKFYVNLESTGNTVSSTIPIALKQLDDAGRLGKGDKLMLVGFGVGLSWGSTILKW